MIGKPSKNRRTSPRPRKTNTVFPRARASSNVAKVFPRRTAFHVQM